MISSRYNEQFKELKSLLEPKGAKKAGKVLVSGRKIIPELVHSALVAIAADDEWPTDLERAGKIIWLDRSLFRDLDVFGTHYPLLVLPLSDLPVWEPQPPTGLELVLSLQNPSNLGAVLRSADAFGVKKVILLKECAFPFHPKAVRASSGSCFRLPYCEGPSLKEYRDDPTIGLDMNGMALNEFEWPLDTRLLIGEEGQGLPSGFTGAKVAIPMRQGLDSLNAGIAASIAIFSYRGQFPLSS
jgi:RNA methyltransferase, TrmH family